MGSEDKMKNIFFLKVYYGLFKLQELGILTSTGVLLTSLIHSLDKKEGKGCKALNPHLSKTLGISETLVESIINGNWIYPKGVRTRKKGLHELGLINYTGCSKKRVLFSNLSNELIDGLINNNSPDEVGGSISNNLQIKSSEPSDKKLTAPRIKKVIPQIKSSEPPTSLVAYKNILDNDKINDKINDKKVFEKTSNATSSTKNSPKKSSRKKKDGKKFTKHYELAEDMFHIVLKLYPDYNKIKFSTVEGIEEVLQKWAKQFKRHLEKGQRDYDETIQVLEYVYSSKKNNFFQFSANKIVNYYDELLVKMGLDNTTSIDTEKLLNDPRPDITERLTKLHQKFTTKDWEPKNSQKNSLIKATKVILQKYGSDATEDMIESAVLDLRETLKQTYYDKGAVIYPGMYCSSHTWNELMPQVFQGVPQMMMKQPRNKQASKEFDDIVAEEEQNTKDIQRNMDKQNPQPNKQRLVGDEDIPELDHMLNI